VANGVIRLGSRLVNWYLVEAEGGLTVVDAGLPGYWPQLGVALEGLGRRLDEVEALVLTHGHVDHIGVAARLSAEAGARILVHEDDAALVQTGKQPPRERSILRYLWRPAALRLFLHSSHAGVASLRRPDRVETFADGEVLDVPGRPSAILVPGHSQGSSCLLFEERGTLFTGDAIVSLNALTGRLGPQVAAGGFNLSSAQALASLDRLEGIEAPVVLFGHGEPWHDGVAAAVAAARRAGPS
jgi:glyoxylase-like metal-dependent hydrolase (beta-lactamase superfamily II)